MCFHYFASKLILTWCSTRKGLYLGGLSTITSNQFQTSQYMPKQKPNSLCSQHVINKKENKERESEREGQGPLMESFLFPATTATHSSGILYFTLAQEGNDLSPFIHSRSQKPRGTATYTASNFLAVAVRTSSNHARYRRRRRVSTYSSGRFCHLCLSR